jgi:hypothetical protein
MRYELADYEWVAIKPMLPNKPRGVPRVNDRRRIMDALAAAHDAAVQMIDTSIVRVHQHGACITRNQRQSMGRSRYDRLAPTTLPSFNSRQSGYGCALMSPRPSPLRLDQRTYIATS